MEVVVTAGAIGRAKLQSNHHHQQTNIQFFTGRMPFLSPNEKRQSTEGFHGLADPKLTWGLSTLSLTTNNSWLPWTRVAMPLISPLMSVPQTLINNNNKRCGTICLRPLQIDDILVFIRQVAPVPACWLFKTSATS